LLDTEAKQRLDELFENAKFEDLINGYTEVTIDDEQVLDAITDYGYNWGIKVLEESVREATMIPELEVNLYLPDKYLVSIGQLSADHVGKLVKIRGLIGMMGSVGPRCEVAVFRCRKCGMETQGVPQPNPFLLIPPFKCTYASVGKKRKCGGKMFDLVPESSELISTQEYMIQELPEDIKRQTPTFIKLVVLKKSLIKLMTCGDKVEVIGVVRAMNTSKKDRYTDLYVEVNNIVQKKKDVEMTELSSSEVDEIQNLGNDPDLYAKMVKSVAPSLHGLILEKEACLHSIFSGVEKKFSDITRRGSIHVFLVGDPSTGKSQLLRAVNSLAPSAIYSSGKGTTAAGLTAAVLRKGQAGDNWIISAGVMVLADKGIACIDEMDKMSKEDRVAIHEAMEQQTVTIDKANVHATLPAKTTVLGAANPSFGRYNIYKTISENIKNLPVTLLSRFDLIFILRDVPEEKRDSAMTSHILSIEKVEGVIERELLKRYIIFAKRLRPKLTKEAGKFLKAKFLELRKRQSEDDPVPITARQFESLIRLSEAHARIFLHKEVTIDDAKSAIRLLTESLKQTCFDVETGKQDIDMKESGFSKNKQQKLEALLELIKELAQLYGGKVHKDAIRQEAEKIGIHNSEFTNLFIQLLNHGKILEVSSEHYAPMR
jgi:replicative DNA helicase Mcm